MLTERDRYSEYGDRRKQAALYDHRADPHEFTNLADDPDHAALVTELRGVLRGGWQAVQRVP